MNKDTAYRHSLLRSSITEDKIPMAANINNNFTHKNFFCVNHFDLALQNKLGNTVYVVSLTYVTN